MLINDMGYSSPIAAFCVSIDVSELLEENMYMIKSFPKSGILREGVWAISSLILLKSAFSVSVHLIVHSYLSFVSKVLLSILNQEQTFKQNL